MSGLLSLTPFVLSEVEGRFAAVVAACFDFAQDERLWGTP